MSGTECSDLSHCECVDSLYAESSLKDVAIRDLEIQLKDLRYLLDECRPWMENGETPAQCIQRNRGDMRRAMEREVVALDKFLKLRDALRGVMGRVE